MKVIHFRGAEMREADISPGSMTDPPDLGEPSTVNLFDYRKSL